MAENNGATHVHLPGQQPSGGYGAGYGGVLPYFGQLQLGGQIAQGNQNLHQEVAQQGRLSGSEHAQIQQSICNAEGKLLANTCHEGREGMKATTDAAHFVQGAIERGSDKAVVASERNGIASRDAIERTGANAINAVERNGSDTRDATWRTSSDVKESVNRNGSDTRDAVFRVGDANKETTNLNGQQNLLSTERNFATLNTGLERSAAELRGLIDRNNMVTVSSSKDNALELLKAKSDLERQNCEGFAAVKLQGCENTNAIQIEAFRNKEALSKQIADCCCELKLLATKQHCDIQQKVDARATETQQLVRDSEANRVREALQACNQENLFLKMAQKGHGN